MLDPGHVCRRKSGSVLHIKERKQVKWGEIVSLISGPFEHPNKTLLQYWGTAQRFTNHLFRHKPSWLTHQNPLQYKDMLIYVSLFYTKYLEIGISDNLRNKEQSVANNFCPILLFIHLLKTVVSKMSSLKHFSLQRLIQYLNADLPNNW